MTTPRLTTIVLAAALLAALPATATAQDTETPSPDATTPEGIDWVLTSIADPLTDELESVPYEIRPTLRLEDGVAAGSAGCNQFSGSYEFDGASLRLDEEIAVTLALCEEEVQRIEDTYLAALGAVDGWLIDDGRLELSDGFGEIVLGFEVPTILWTAGQMADLESRLEAMQAQLEAAGLELEALREQAEGQDIVPLRRRIRDLEAANDDLVQRLDALEEQPTSNGGGQTSFTRAERVLLEGVPGRIANTCAPRRSSLPKGTRAAVTCAPNPSAVASVNYYLLEGEDAANAFGDTMATFNVPEATFESNTCEQGVKSQRYWLGNGWQAEGCYRTNQRAELRFVDNATDCRKLKVGGRTLQSPAFLIELQGADNDVARVHAWATRNLGAGGTQRTSITRPIARPNAALSPSCPT